MRLGVVIPAHNEARRLPGTLRRLEALAKQRQETLEVVVVDDGSTDDTLEAATRCATAWLELKTVRFAVPRGPGAAAREGMLLSTAHRALLCDADGPVPFEDLALLERALDAGADLAAGSRTLDPARNRARRPLHRRAMAHTWRAAVRTLVPTSIDDTQCGFKLFTRDAARAIFARAQQNSFVFHVELCWLAERQGLRLAEVPVRWRDVPGSKVRLARDPARMLRDLVGLARACRCAGDADRLERARPADRALPLPW